MRWVNNTVGSCRNTIGIRTDAATAAPSANLGSASSSGCQTGGITKRWRNASGLKVDAATGGRWASTPITGTLRGSKFGNFDSGVVSSIEVMGACQIGIKKSRPELLSGRPFPD